jgi:Flp pilus assembly protein TadD
MRWKYRFPACLRSNPLLILVPVLCLLMANPAMAQQGGGGGGGGTGNGGGGGGASPPSQGQQGNMGNQGQTNDVSPEDQQAVSLTVDGRVMADTGHPFNEPVTLVLFCGMRILQSIHTDSKGYFSFILGQGAQSDEDFSAANDIEVVTPDGRMLNTPGSNKAPSEVVDGCEIRVSVPSYRPLVYNMHGRADLGRVDVGTLTMERIAGVPGAAISVSTLLIPDGARKEFDRGEKDAGNKDLKSAAMHLEKAVAQYDKYAAAWNELGRIYSSNNDNAKAEPAFEKAIAADPSYAPPYINLANLQLQELKDEDAVTNADKALQIDPNNGFALMLDAMGNFNLNHLDEAEKKAKQAEQGPHAGIPQLHALLANVYLRKQNYTGAAEEMRAYLKEAPQGQFADQMKTNLDQVEKTEAAAAGDTSGAAPAPPKTAP